MATKQPYYEDDQDEDADVISIDGDGFNADWTKQGWDLPPYRSPEFMALYPDLDAFKTTPAYHHAVEQGLIHDDEWVADHVEPVKE